MLLVLSNPQIGPYQMLPLRPRVDLRAMAMKGFSAFPKAPALLDLTIRLFNYLYNLIGLVRFNGISAIKGYLMVNLFRHIY